MKKERFEYQHSVRGCEWAIIAPIFTSLFVALGGLIYCAIAGIDSAKIADSAAYLIIGTAFTELSFLISAILISKRNNVNMLRASGIAVASPWWMYLGAIAISIVTLFCLNPLIGCWQTLLEVLGHTITELPLAIDSVPNLFLGIALFALIPAVCEEFLFRGLILNGLRKYGVWVSVLVSSAFFSVMHMSLLQLPYTFVLGVVLGVVVYYTRNLGLSMLMHFVNNTTVLVIGYFTINNTYTFVWTDILIGLAGLAIFGVMLFFLGKFLHKKFLPNTTETEAPHLAEMPEIAPRDRQRMWYAPVFIAAACLIISILSGFGVL